MFFIKTLFGENAFLASFGLGSLRIAASVYPGTYPWQMVEYGGVGPISHSEQIDGQSLSL